MAEAEVQTIKTDKQLYVIGDKITFSGTVQTGDAGSQVNLEITGPQGNYIDTFSNTANSNNTFQIILDTSNSKIQSEFPQQGTYNAIAFIKARSSALPTSFDYSPIAPPPARPASMQSIPTQNNIGSSLNKTESPNSTNPPSTLNQNTNSVLVPNSNPQGTPVNSKQSTQPIIINQNTQQTPSSQLQPKSSSNQQTCDYTCQQAKMYSAMTYGQSDAQKELYAEQQACAENPSACAEYQVNQRSYGSYTPQEPSYFGLTGFGIVFVIAIIIIIVIIALVIRRAVGNRGISSRSDKQPERIRPRTGMIKETDDWEGV